MVRIHGKAMVATWRPYEEGGRSHLRASQMESDDVTVLGDLVIAQHKDGFWATYPLVNCSIIWNGRPEVTLIADVTCDTPLVLQGRLNTLADELASHPSKVSYGPRSMSSSADENDRPNG